MGSIKQKPHLTFTLLLFLCCTVIFVEFYQHPHQSAASETPPLIVNDSSLEAIQGYFILYHTMELKIQDDYSLQIISTLVVENNDSQPIDFFIFFINKSVNTIFVYDPIGPLSFTWAKNDAAHSSVLNISMRYPLLEDDKYVLSISYEIDPSAQATYLFFISDFGGYYNLEFPLIHSIRTEHFQFEISLPGGHLLLSGPSPRPVFPYPTKIDIIDNHVKLIWIYNSIDLNYDYSYFVRFNKTALGDSPIIYVQLPKAFFAYLVLSFLLGSIGSGTIFYFILKKRVQPTKTKLVSSLLSEAEQAVIQAINEEGGMAIQRKICERTGFSKSKVSQILLKLEEKDVLKRERWGRTNRVTITNPSFLNLDLAPGEQVKEE
ncbi:MAG: winged helix DNA-binding protein [Candidatus Heimdallarchaeota archaeon]|nr:winged helix DNA-binding protein [Candidatus Heimdallarchaeota archaeon]